MLLLMLLIALVPALSMPLPSASAVASPEGDWRSEFDDVCGRTQDSMMLSKNEVRLLVERCDRLRPRIERLDESASKVYLKRLQMCRDLFVFILESESPISP